VTPTPILNGEKVEGWMNVASCLGLVCKEVHIYESEYWSGAVGCGGGILGIIWFPTSDPGV